MSELLSSQRMETWRVIPGYEGLYEISDLGRVCSFNRRLLKPFFVKDIILVALYDGHNHKRRLSLSRLVAEAFVLDKPGGWSKVVHRDGDVFNNAASNPYWQIQKPRVRRPRVLKLGPDDVAKIRSTPEELGRTWAEKLAVSESMISLIRSGKRRKEASPAPTISVENDPPR